MNIKEFLKRSEAMVCIVSYLKKVWRIPSVMRRTKMIKNYMESNKIKKLQIGSGQTIHNGWLSTDIAPRTANIMLLDATKAFPLEDNTFDFIYSEHMIEHITWHEGLFMLQECKRILKPGGIIRIATPDLKVMISLYDKENPLNEKYITWITDNFLNDIPVYKAPFVMNSAFRNWGHTFLYDDDVLKMTMQKAGFIDIQQCSYGQSQYDSLQDIETHGNNVSNVEMATFETMIFEGICPK